MYRPKAPADWVGIYYFGAHYTFSPKDDPRRNDFARVTGWRYVLVALYEIPTVIAAVLCSYRWSVIGPTIKGYRPVPPEWIAACLPPVVVGVCLLIASEVSSLQKKRKGHGFVQSSSTFRYVIYGTIPAALIVVGVAYVLSVYFGPPRSDRDLATRPTELPTMIAWYVLIGTPLPVLPLIDKSMIVQVILLLPAVLGRGFGFFLGAADFGRFDERKCRLDHQKWQGVMIGFMVLSFLLGLFGFGLCEGVCSNSGDQRRGGNSESESGNNNTATTAPENVPLGPQARPPQYAESQTQWQAGPLRRDSDTDALLEPPPPYTPSRSPTYVERP